ncbi:hypothetical protein EMIT0P12_20691 [Pseudomonas sp. IT-P12]
MAFSISDDYYFDPFHYYLLVGFKVVWLVARPFAPIGVAPRISSFLIPP